MTNNNPKDNKKLRTFSVRETNSSIVKKIKNTLFEYKHVENIINILLNNLLELDNTNLTEEEIDLNKSIFWLLLNPVIMKAILGNTLGRDKTSANIAKVNSYFKDNELFNQLKLACNSLNSHNLSMLVRRLAKDWNNYFSALKDYKTNPNYTGKPNYPKAKKLSKVFNYSLPLEQTKYSLKKKGYLGINLGKKIFYTYLGQSDYFKDKLVNNVTISFSHGFVYYNFTYEIKETSIVQINDNILPTPKPKKEAGGDIGLNNLLSIFINDEQTQSLIISGKELISYNCYFNKTLASLNELISYEVKSYKNIIRKDGIFAKVPESYTNKGKNLIKEKSILFERRNLYFEDYMNKISKKVLEYLSYAKVTDLALSRNLSFTKTGGSIKMQGKTKQKFYQIPFGNLLNLIEQKSIQYEIQTEFINEAYTSKTSSVSSNVINVQNKSKALKLKQLNKEEISNNDLITPNDLKGNRGVKSKELKNKLGRGLFKDTTINKVLNADLNAACNHIKVAFNNNMQQLNTKLWKWCNPVKIKSNHEFDLLLKSMSQIVDTRIGINSYLLSR